MALAKCRRDFLQQGGYIGGYWRATIMYACNPAQDRLNDCEYNEGLVGVALQERVRWVQNFQKIFKNYKLTLFLLAESKNTWARKTTGQSGGVKNSVPSYLLSPSKLLEK